MLLRLTFATRKDLEDRFEWRNWTPEQWGKERTPYGYGLNEVTVSSDDSDSSDSEENTVEEIEVSQIITIKSESSNSTSSDSSFDDIN